MLIAGEAGLGKTTLVRAFADGVRTDDLPVLVGGCDDLVTPRTMGPLRDIARELGGPLAAALAGDADPERSSRCSPTSSRRARPCSSSRTCTGPTTPPST